MAIIFARLDPVHLTTRSGAARLIAYTGRTVIADRGFFHDYRHLAADLVHEEVMLPADYPAAFYDPEILAGALDRAELQKVRTPLELRNRLPQVGLALTIALPPDDEVFLHEAAEIVRRVVNAARGSHPIPIHCAIHDSRLNRHGHALLGGVRRTRYGWTKTARSGGANSTYRGRNADRRGHRLAVPRLGNPTGIF